VHERHGRTPWRDLIEPAAQWAEQGFPVSPRLYALLKADRFLRGNPRARALFYRDDGSPVPEGTMLRNPQLADILRTIAREGPKVFYSTPIAHEIVEAVRNDPRHPGLLAESDLARYRAIEREPVCDRFREYRICSAAPPSSGGVTVLQILRILDRTPFAGLLPESVMSAHLFSEAGRLAYADRDRYLADPDFASVPVKALLAAPYIEARRSMIDPRRSLGVALPGTLPEGVGLGPGETIELASTTHLSVVDRDGNAVSMSSSIESAFGSRTMVHGFLLNNQLTDFSFMPERDGRHVANRVESGKRPRSTMAPTIVFDSEGKVKMLLGSPGGSWIANYVAQVLALTLAQGRALDAALATPHWGSRNGPTELERGTPAGALRGSLEHLGHNVRLIDMTSGVHAIERVGDHWVGAADPRREGMAVGR
jgi:gamma-glutamyltranspeptidase / glutathione hydrolase